jgi:hypothetical protein
MPISACAKVSLLFPDRFAARTTRYSNEFSRKGEQTEAVHSVGNGGRCGERRQNTKNSDFDAKTAFFGLKWAKIEG